MPKITKNDFREILVLLLALVISSTLLIFNWKYLTNILFNISQNKFPNLSSLHSSNNTSSNSQIKSSENKVTSKLDTSLPDPKVLSIDGSVTIVALVKQLQIAYNFLNPSLPTTYGIPDGMPNGSNLGIKNLMDGKVAIAASSRFLKPHELQAGLVEVPIARDALAIAVSVDNPYKGGLSMEQLKGIFQGQITNWSEVGGANIPIKVINRSPNSGTYTFFQDKVLSGQAFAPDSKNFMTLHRDETTPILRALGNNGISYSTVTQLENQRSIRILPINGISPKDKNLVKSGIYPISRVVYLALPQKTSRSAKEFADLALSPQGQQAIEQAGFIPLK